MNEEEIDLRDYIRIMWKRRYVILVVFLAALITSTVVSFLKKPIHYFQAYTILKIGSINDKIIEDEKIIEEVIKSDQMLAEANESLNLNMRPARWAGIFEIEKTKPLFVKIMVNTQSQKMSNKILTFLAQNIMKRQNQNINNILKEYDQTTIKRLEYFNVKLKNMPKEVLKIELQSPAYELTQQIISPTAREITIHPKRKLYILIAAILGLMVGVGLAFILEYFEGFSLKEE